MNGRKKEILIPQVLKKNMKTEINLRSRIFEPTYQSLADPLHRPS